MAEDVWRRLTPDFIQNIASRLHPNEVAGALKLVSTETAAALRDRKYRLLTLGSKQANTREPHRACNPWPGHAFVAHWARPGPWRALTQPQRERLLCLAASSGHVPSLEAALVHSGCCLKPRVLTSAAAAGNVAGCERLLAEGCSFNGAACLAAAAASGHLPTLQLLLDACRPHAYYNWEAGMRAAAASGNLPALQLLNDVARDGNMLQRAEGLEAVAKAACGAGQLRVLDWLQQEHGYSPCLDAVDEAAREGQVAVLERMLLPILPPPPPPDPEQESGMEAAAAAAAATAAEPHGAPGITGETHDAFLERRKRESRRQLLMHIVQGCPAALLERVYPSLAAPWAPTLRWAAHVLRPEHRRAAAVAPPPPPGGHMGAASGDPQAAVEDLVEVLGLWLCAAAGSTTPCWRDKVDFLLDSWGPAVAGRVLRGSRGRSAACAAGERPADQDDCVVRLRHLQKRGLPIEPGSQLAGELTRSAAHRGHVSVLLYLYSECGVPLPTDSEFVKQYALGRANGPATAAAAVVEAAARQWSLLRLLRRRGAALKPGHVAAACDQRMNACEEGLIWLTWEAAAAAADAAAGLAAEGGGGAVGHPHQHPQRRLREEEEEGAGRVRRVWSLAFSRAAQNGAGLPLLKALRACGAAVDLAAVAQGCSEEALGWAAAELEAQYSSSAGGVQLYHVEEAGCGSCPSDVTNPGNGLALLRLLDHWQLLLPPQQLQQQPDGSPAGAGDTGPDPGGTATVAVTVAVTGGTWRGGLVDAVRVLDQSLNFWRLQLWCRLEAAELELQVMAGRRRQRQLQHQEEVATAARERQQAALLWRRGGGLARRLGWLLLSLGKGALGLPAALVLWRRRARERRHARAEAVEAAGAAEEAEAAAARLAVGGARCSVWARALECIAAPPGPQPLLQPCPVMGAAATAVGAAGSAAATASAPPAAPEAAGHHGAGGSGSGSSSSAAGGPDGCSSSPPAAAAAAAAASTSRVEVARHQYEWLARQLAASERELEQLRSGCGMRSL